MTGVPSCPSGCGIFWTPPKPLQALCWGELLVYSSIMLYLSTSLLVLVWMVMLCFAGFLSSMASHFHQDHVKNQGCKVSGVLLKRSNL